MENDENGDTLTFESRFTVVFERKADGDTYAYTVMAIQLNPTLIMQLLIIMIIIIHDQASGCLQAGREQRS